MRIEIAPNSIPSYGQLTCVALVRAVEAVENRRDTPV
jgi:hypothetical protein